MQGAVDKFVTTVGRMRRWVVNTMIIVLVILGIDFSLSQYCKGNCSFWTDVQNLRQYRIKVPVYNHDLASKAEFYDMYAGRNYQVHTNSLGFKDATVRNVFLKGKQPRVLFIGDSFTEGVGLEYPETMVGRVAMDLEKDGVEVLNAGVAGYSPLIYWRKVKHLLEDVGLKVDEVVAVVDISDVFDEERYYMLDDAGNVEFRDDTPEGLEYHFDNWRNFRRWARDNSVLVRFGYAVRDTLRQHRRKKEHALRTEAAGFQRPDPASPRADMWSFKHGSFTWDREQYDFYGRPGLEKASANMDHLAQLLAEQDIPLTLVIYPWPDQILYGEGVVSARRHWRDWAEAHGVPVIDLWDDFARLEALSGLSKLEFLDKYFIRFDVHWNALGSAEVARWVADGWRAHRGGGSSEFGTEAAVP